jgi:hypothetical protein
MQGATPLLPLEQAEKKGEKHFLSKKWTIILPDGQRVKLEDKL